MPPELFQILSFSHSLSLVVGVKEGPRKFLPFPEPSTEKNIIPADHSLTTITDIAMRKKKERKCSMEVDYLKFIFLSLQSL